MDGIGNIVNDILDARGWRSKVLERMAVELWPEVVGDHIAMNTMALRYSSGTLHIRARSPQWTQELHFHQARIIARLNGRLRQNIVHKIRCTVTPPRGIKVGSLKPTWEDPTFPAQTPLPRGKREHCDDDSSRRAIAIAAEIEDEEMRATMERLIASVFRARGGEPEPLKVRQLT